MGRFRLGDTNAFVLGFDVLFNLLQAFVVFFLCSVISSGEYMIDDNGPVLVEVNCRICGGDMDSAINAEADDVIDNEEYYTIYTDPNNLLSVKESLEKDGINEFERSEVTYIADNLMTLDDEKTDKVMELIELLEDIDDVQDVYHNMNV